MTFGRRIALSAGGLIILLLVIAGIGIGLTAWLQSWHNDYLAAAQGTEALSNPDLRNMLDTLDSWTGALLIVVAVVTAVALALGIRAAIVFSRTIDRRLRAAVTGIGGSAAQLLAVATEVAAGTAQTAAATNETTATVEEAKQTALHAQEKAAEASEVSQQVAERCRHGQTSAEQNYGMFERIGSDMEVVADAIDRLNEQAQSVGDIIATVNDLAEQSNLLSVNASIEASKAGEQGKGFTVVAQEVKSLAEQSKQAVAQVRAVLSEIQKASEVAVRAAQQSKEAIDAGRSEAEYGIESTKTEVDLANKAAEATVLISTTSQQQLAGMEQIGRAIESISQATNQAVTGTRQIEQEVEHLQELADSLKGLVEVAVQEAD